MRETIKSVRIVFCFSVDFFTKAKKSEACRGWVCVDVSICNVTTGGVTVHWSRILNEILHYIRLSQEFRAESRWFQIGDQSG